MKRMSYAEALDLAVRTVYGSDWWPGTEEYGMTEEKNGEVVDLLDELLGIDVNNPHRQWLRDDARLRDCTLAKL